MLIFEKGRPGRHGKAQFPHGDHRETDIPADQLRQDKAHLPEVSELQAVRHYTKLSQKNFCIDTQFYPLGSCTMKYNPRGANRYAMLPGFLNAHPLRPQKSIQGYLACMYELQTYLAEVTGMAEVALSPMAGAQGEFAGVAMIKAYHDARGDTARQEFIVPDAAHGTNPASAVMCGYKVREVPTTAEGDVDLEALKGMLGPQTAGIMLTNPSTLGVFEREIATIAKMVHEAGGLLYYDGANLNAILGKTKPGDMGFDVMHMNLHKTFATPHGGGGPGAGPVAVAERLVPYLPVPRVEKTEEGYRWRSASMCPETIGYLSAFMGNAGVLLRAYIYVRLLGREGLVRAGEYATLNANYLQKRLRDAGFDLAFPTRRASHEFIITFKKALTEQGFNAMDVAKRLLDFDMHAPTTYFPLLVPECFLIEPTETEDKATMDEFVDALVTIVAEEAKTLHEAPYTQPRRRLDDVRAAKQLDLTWVPETVAD